MIKKIYLVLLLLFSFFVGYAQSGTNDNFFNTADSGGYNHGFNKQVHTVVIQNDGKILVGGNFTIYNGIIRNNIIRLYENGSVDLSFNLGSGFNGYVKNIVLQDDGKIIVGGWFTEFNGTPRKNIARLNQNGSLDLSFNPGTGFDSFVWAVALQSDGKILIGGWFSYFNGVYRRNITRLNSNGTLDNTFNIGLGFNSAVSAIAIKEDGKILVGGFFTSYDNSPHNGIVSLNNNGTVDLSFTTGLGCDSAVACIVIQQDGEILIGGSFSQYNGISRSKIARLNSDGTLDESFNPNLGFDKTVKCIAIQSNGKYVAGGEFTFFNGIEVNYITRLNANGSIDDQFDTGFGFNDWVLNAKIQNDGKILVVGRFFTYNGIPRTRIVRIMGDIPTVEVNEVEVLEKASLKIYPNPFHDIFNLDFEGAKKNKYEVKIINNFGQEIFKKAFHDETVNIFESFDLSSFPSGIYYIFIDSKLQFVSRKIVKI